MKPSPPVNAEDGWPIQAPFLGLSGVSAVILAAGRSSRMGEAKQLLPLGESTVLETTIANVRRSTIQEIVLVLGAAADIIRSRLTSELNVVVNHDYAQGMASSLQAGISALSPEVEAALIVLADQPFVRPETHSQLITEYKRSKRQILIPTYRGTRGNPVLIARSLFPEVMELSGDIGCRALFARHPQSIQNVEVEDEGILLDIDNKEDYRKLSASH